MILICYDCPGKYPDEAKMWLYPCEECAQEFLDRHLALGHHIRAREETYGDRLMMGWF